MIPGLILAAFLSSSSHAADGRAQVGGYLRVMTRPDFQGGGGRLGYWNLYGRLLNEGPYATLDFRYDVLERQAGSPLPWTALHLRVEGGSIGNADAGNGNLANLRLSQAFVSAGNVLLPDVTWQVGTLERYMGDLGLYDMRPAQLFTQAVGASAQYERERFDLLLGAGDSGYGIHGAEYNTVFTGGGWARARPIDQLQLGVGGEYRYEPAVPGNRYAPYATPGLDYEDWLRGEVVQSYLQDNPGREIDFPAPDPVSATSWKGIGYLGFGAVGPLVWSNLFASYERLHPQMRSTETYDGQTYTLYTSALTDERTQLMVGDEIQLRVVPERLDLALAGLYGRSWDDDNAIAPSDYDRMYRSVVARAQVYLTPTLHLLVESSLAEERSENGNAYREHADSIFENTGGTPDSRGLELGDTDTRTTWQGKGGLVLNPLGPGIFARPSLRLLYGAQYSNQNNAFGNSFVETLDQYNEFGNVERHWHHVVALETEVWF